MRDRDTLEFEAYALGDEDAMKELEELDRYEKENWAPSTAHSDFLMNLMIERTHVDVELEGKPSIVRIEDYVEKAERDMLSFTVLHFSEAEHPIYVYYAIRLGVIVAGYDMTAEEEDEHLYKDEHVSFLDDEPEWNAVLVEDMRRAFQEEIPEPGYMIWDRWKGRFIRRHIDLRWHCEVDL